MIGEAIARREARGDRRRLGVAGAAQRVGLGMAEFPLDPNNVQIFGRLSGRRCETGLHMRSAGAVASLAVDSGLDPDGAVEVGDGIVIIGNLADVATAAGRVESEAPVHPADRPRGGRRRVRRAARRHVEPLAFAHVVGDRQGLQPAAIEFGEEIDDVLAAERLNDAIARFNIAVSFAHPALAGPDFGPVGRRAGDDVRRLGGQVGRRKGVGIGTHRQAVP